MSRKRSPAGRTAKASLTSQTYINLKKANKRIKGLRASGDFGTYASKDILRLVSSNKNVRFNKKKQLKISKPHDINFAEMRLINKQLKEFNKAKTGTPGGIAEVKASTKAKMKETLSGLTDEQISDSDVEFLYSLFNDKNVSNLFDYITPSELLIILKDVEKKGGAFEDFWIELLNYIDTTNLSDLREQALAIYNNYMQYKTL